MAIRKPNIKRDALAREISKLASKANKRIKRLEGAGLEHSPAYQAYIENRKGAKFSVKGKDYNQLQKEQAHLLNFINAETSTIRGLNKSLKTMANATGIKYKKIGELHEKTKVFFEISSKIEQYLKNVAGAGSSIGYNKIWDVINKEIKSKDLDLLNIGNDLDAMAIKIAQLGDFAPTVDKWNYSLFGKKDNSFQ